MKTLRQLFISLSLFTLFLGYGFSDQNTETLYYGAESKGVLCGYSEVRISQAVKDGRKILSLEENGEVKLTKLYR